MLNNFFFEILASLHEVTWECHVLLLDAWLSKLNSIVTIAAHNEECASRGKKYQTLTTLRGESPHTWRNSWVNRLARQFAQLFPYRVRRALVFLVFHQWLVLFHRMLQSRAVSCIWRRNVWQPAIIWAPSSIGNERQWKWTLWQLCELRDGKGAFQEWSICGDNWRNNHCCLGQDEINKWYSSNSGAKKWRAWT